MIENGELAMSEISIGRIYRHYKGTHVKVLSIVLHSETREEMVHYIHLEDGIEWVRPRAMFLEDVVVEGKTVPRFELLT